MRNYRCQGTSPYLKSQSEHYQPSRRIESPNFETDLNYLKHSKQSNASEERHQLHAIENVLNNFFKGELVVKELITKIGNSIIRNQFNNLVLFYFSSKYKFQEEERELKDAMAEVNHHLTASLKYQWPYSIKFRHNSKLIDYGVLNDLVKELNGHKLCKSIINSQQQAKVGEYAGMLKMDSYHVFTKLNSMISNNKKTVPTQSKALEQDILLSLKQLYTGKYNESQSSLRYSSMEIHRQFLYLDNLLKEGLRNKRGQKQLSQYEYLIEKRSLQLESINKEVNCISKKFIEISDEIKRQQFKLQQIKQRIIIYGRKRMTIEHLQQQKKKLEGNINQLIKQNKDKEWKITSILSELQQQESKKTQQISFYKQQFKDKEKKLAECEFEYQSLQSKSAKLQKQNQQLINRSSVAKQIEDLRLEMKQVKAVTIISEKQAELSKIMQQCSKKEQDLRSVNDAYVELKRQKEENVKNHQRESCKMAQLLEEKQNEIDGLTEQNELFIKKDQKLQKIIEDKEKDNQELQKKLNEKTDQYNLKLFQHQRRNDSLLEQQQRLTSQKKQTFQKLSRLKQFSEGNKEQIANIKAELLHFKDYFIKEFQQYTKISKQLISKDQQLILCLELKMKEKSQNNIIQTAQVDHQKLQENNEEVIKLTEQINAMRTELSQKNRELQENFVGKSKFMLLQQENHRLQSIISAMEASNTQQNSMLNLLNGQNVKLRQELESSKSEMKTAQKSFADLVEKLNQENETAILSLRQRLEQEKAEKERQKIQQINSLKININNLKREHNQYFVINTLIANSLKQIRSNNEQLKENNLGLSEENNRLIKEKQVIQKDFDELSKNYEILLGENGQLQSTIGSTSSQSQLLQQYKINFNQLDNEYNLEVNKSKQFEKELSQLREDINNQQQNSLKMASLAQQNSKLCKRLQSEKQQLQKDNLALKEKEKTIKSTFSPEQKKKLEKKIRQYKEQIDHLTEQIDLLNSNMEEMTRMNLENNCQADMAKYQEDNSKIQELCRQLTLQNNANKEEIRQKQEQIRRLRKEAQDLCESYKDLEQQIAIQKQLSQLKIEELEKRIKAVELQKTETNIAYQQLQTKCDLLNAKLEASMSEYYEMQRAFNSQRNSMEASYIENDLLFQNDVLEGQIQHKKYLRQVIQHHMRFKIWKSKLIFRFDVQNKVNFHRYIDDKEHLVIVMKMKNGNYLAAYTEGSFQPQKVSTQDALIISITNQETFRFIDRSKRAITYDEYYIIFGNSEIRIRSQENKIFSNFAISNGYYETKGKKVPTLLGGGPSDRQLQFQHYEIYQLDVIYDL